MTVAGVDVSHYQGTVDWRAVAASGRAFAVVKATEGATYLDPLFHRNVNDARAAGLIVGAYHFGRPGAAGTNADAGTEAAHFLAAAGGVDFAVLDLEDPNVPAGRPLAGWVSTWLAKVEAATSRTPWLYTYGSYWRQHGSTDPRWRRYPLWLADYTPPAGLLAPWGHYTVWQYSSSGTVPGVTGRCDVDTFDGSLRDFRQLVGLSMPPVDPPQPFPGDHMLRMPIRITTGADGRGYADVDVDYSRVVSILLGGDEPSDGWGPYVGAPAYAIAWAGRTRVVIPESPVISGFVDLVVWVTSP